MRRAGLPTLALALALAAPAHAFELSSFRPASADGPFFGLAPLADDPGSVGLMVDYGRDPLRETAEAGVYRHAAVAHLVAGYSPAPRWTLGIQLGALHADGDPSRAYVDGAALTDGRLSLRWLALRQRHVSLQLEAHGRAPLASVDGPVGQATGGGLAFGAWFPVASAMTLVAHVEGGAYTAHRSRVVATVGAAFTPAPGWAIPIEYASAPWLDPPEYTNRPSEVRAGVRLARGGLRLGLMGGVATGNGVGAPAWRVGLLAGFVLEPPPPAPLPVALRRRPPRPAAPAPRPASPPPVPSAAWDGAGTVPVAEVYQPRLDDAARRHLLRVPAGAALKVVGHGPGGLDRARRVARALGALGYRVQVARAGRADPRTVAGASPAAHRVAVWRLP